MVNSLWDALRAQGNVGALAGCVIVAARQSKGLPAPAQLESALWQEDPDRAALLVVAKVAGVEVK